MKRALLAGTIAALGLGSFAYAQQPAINVVPQVGMIWSILKQQTYSAVALGLTPAAAPTDIFCINGSTSKNVALTYVQIQGSGNPQNAAVFIKQNHALDTGGTPYAGNGAPVAVSNLSGGTAATATVTAYTANPTINDAVPVNLRGGYIAVVPALSAGAPNSAGSTWQFGAQIDEFDYQLTIPKAATVTNQYCVNLSGAALSGSPQFQVTMEWIEY